MTSSVFMPHHRAKLGPVSSPNLGRPNGPDIGRCFRNNGGVTNEELRRVLARNVRVRLDKHQWSQTKLGSESGMGKSTIGHILACDAAATLDTVAQLARAFGCQPWELLVDEEATRREALKRMLG